MNSVKSITIIGLFTAITIVLANTIGFIPIGPISITTMHIPVIICGIIFGKEYGAVMGLIFGLISLFRSYSQPNITSFIFMNPLVSVLPRIIFGLSIGYIFDLVKKTYNKKTKYILIGLLAIGGTVSLIMSLYLTKPNNYLALMIFGLCLVLIAYTLKNKDLTGISSGITAVISTGLHSILVLGAIYLLYAEAYVEALGMAVGLIVVGALVNMVFEMAVSALLVPPIIVALERSKE